MSDLFELLSGLDQDQGPWVLVTLMATEGSTYRKAGAHLLLGPHEYRGMLSGGCLEAEVMARCGPLLRGEEKVLTMEIDTRRLLGCHGKISLVAESLPDGLADQIAEISRHRRRATLYTSHPGPGWRPTSLRHREKAYEHVLLPPLRLVVFGSVPGALPLLEMAAVLGWQTEQVVLAQDPAVSLRANAVWTVLPSAAQAERLVDDRTVCIVMNHHVGRDTETLLALWKTDTPFLGMLGSRRRRDEILERIAWTVDLDSRVLHAPVGIDLGAEGASEIALEICAQVQRELSRNGSERPSRVSSAS